MKKFVSLVLLGIFLSVSNAFAFDNCKDVYEGKLLRREKARARRTATSVFVGMFAISPLVTPLGAMTFGSFALAVLGTGQGMHWMNKKKFLLPHEIKELMLIDESLNPNLPLHIKKSDPNVILFGRHVGYDLTFTAESKKVLLEKFVEHLKQKYERYGGYTQLTKEITPQWVRGTISRLMNEGRKLCTHPDGQEQALKMFRFENVLLWELDSM